MKRQRGLIYFSLLLGLLCAMVMIGAGSLKVRANETAVEISTLADLRTKLSQTGSYKLTADITLGASDLGLQIPENVTVTLDLNGKKIEKTAKVQDGDDYVLAVHKGGSLTVEDNSSSQTGRIWTETAGVMCGIKMTVKGDTSSNNAVLTVKGGEIQGYNYGISGNGKRNGTIITIQGGTIRAYDPNDSTGIYQPQDGTLSISGGTISGATGIEIRSGTLNVTGGTIQGTGSPSSVTSNSEGTTTIGAGIAVAQHTTQQAINVDISDNAHITGLRPVLVSNPENNNSENPVKVKLPDTLLSSMTVGSPDEYGWVKDNEGYLTFHQHNYPNNPKWWWTRTDGVWSAKSIYICTVSGCKHKKELPANVALNGSKYTATDTNGESRDVADTAYNVTVTGGKIEGDTPSAQGTFEWGQLATVLADGENPVQWKIDSNVVADGIKKYVFAVTGTTSLTTASTAETTGKPVIVTSLIPGANIATFNAKWSLPENAKVISAIIYRGHTTNGGTITAETLVAKGTQYDTGLNVATGDFTLNLDELTANTYQYVMIQIKYALNGTEQTPLTSDVKSVQITTT